MSHCLPKFLKQFFLSGGLRNQCGILFYIELYNYWLSSSLFLKVKNVIQHKFKIFFFLLSCKWVIIHIKNIWEISLKILTPGALPQNNWIKIFRSVRVSGVWVAQSVKCPALLRSWFQGLWVWAPSRAMHW